MNFSVLAGLEAHRDKLESPEWGLYYHGTQQGFTVPDFTKVGMSSDANSALGFFVAASPGAAADYADMVSEAEPGAVLVTLVRQGRGFEFDSFDSFYGADWPSGDPGHDREHFERERQRLVADGYDTAWFTLADDGDIGIALLSENVIVLGEISVEQARELWQREVYAEAYVYRCPCAWDDKEAVLEELGEVLESSASMG